MPNRCPDLLEMDLVCVSPNSSHVVDTRSDDGLELRAYVRG